MMPENETRTVHHVYVIEVPDGDQPQGTYKSVGFQHLRFDRRYTDADLPDLQQKIADKHGWPGCRLTLLFATGDEVQTQERAFGRFVSPANVEALYGGSMEREVHRNLLIAGYDGRDHIVDIGEVLWFAAVMAGSR
ncbi:hypothetical protein ABT369_39015 [Dactylosporangium sp. NPDC000244]|uniref:hypothetical protein n=1 Tax=Dactylosporangium sp. NPDC000244 TaxID=3154365 RepID=UPI00331C48E6